MKKKAITPLVVVGIVLVTLFAVLFIFVGIQMVGIGLIGEYIGRIYTDVRARPRYFIEEVIGGGDGNGAEK